MADRLRIACYGTNGHQILGHMKDHPRAVLTAVAEVSAETVEKVLGAEAARDVRVLPDLDALIADDDVDLISFCSPRRDEQLDQSLRALAAGKHVLAEKPCAFTAAEVDRLAEAIEAAEAEFWPMAACQREGVLEAIRRLVDAGALGTVAHVEARKSYPWHPGRPQDRGIDGGLIRQAGIHGVRYIQWATGQKAVRVSAVDTTAGDPGAGNLQMAAEIVMELDGGAVARLGCDYLNRKGFGHWGNEMVRVSGSGGFAEAVDGFSRRRMFVGDEPEAAIPGADEEFVDFTDALIDHLLDGAPMPWSVADDLHALRTICRAQEAAETGRVVEV